MEHTPESINNKIMAIVARSLKTNTVVFTPDTRLIEELGADSLDALSIAMDIDREFGIKVVDSELSSFLTCKDIASAVTRHLNNQTMAVAASEPVV
jgi:acyl carrier protein